MTIDHRSNRANRSGFGPSRSRFPVHRGSLIHCIFFFLLFSFFFKERKRERENDPICQTILRKRHTKRVDERCQKLRTIYDLWLTISKNVDFEESNEESMSKYYVLLYGSSSDSREKSDMTSTKMRVSCSHWHVKFFFCFLLLFIYLFISLNSLPIMKKKRRKSILFSFPISYSPFVFFSFFLFFFSF